MKKIEDPIFKKPSAAEIAWQLAVDIRNYIRYRKSEIKDIELPDEQKFGGFELPELEHKPKLVNGVYSNFNTHAINQIKLGLPMGCTACAAMLVMTCQYVRKYRDKGRAFDCRVQWAEQKKYPGTASDTTGDYLGAPFKTFEKVGQKLNGKLYKCEKQVIIPKTVDDFVQAISKGYCIKLGAKFGFRRTDMNRRMIFKENGYGHDFVVVGVDTIKQEFLVVDSDGSNRFKTIGFDQLGDPGIFQARTAKLIEA